MNRRTLRIVGIVCLCVFLLPGFHLQSNFDGKSERHTTVFSLGVMGSPWLSYEKREVQGQTLQSEFGLRVLSWSWLVLAAGLLALRLASKDAPLRSDDVTSSA